jgi:diadenylate cyclase
MRELMNLLQWFTEMPEWAYVLMQFVILVAIIYFVYNRFIRKSQAEKLLKGLLVILIMLIGAWGMARIFQFKVFEVLVGSTINLLIIFLFVIFQPEIRRMLMYLGQPDLFGRRNNDDTLGQLEHMVHELAESVKYLSKSKTGALIVLETEKGTGEYYLEMGTNLDARLSTELLLTIFHPRTPLHDGAVVVNLDSRVVAAGVLLPLTEDPKLSWQYGTRHRAAIGLAEVTNSYCVVVSEETGGISLVHNGSIEKIANADELKKRLQKIFHVNVDDGRGRKLRTMERLTEIFSGDQSHPLQRLFSGRETGDDDTPKRTSGGK